MQLPFDNVSHRTIFVDLTDWHSTEQARSRLAEATRAIRAPGYRVSNPITQANASFKMRQSEDPRERLIADIQERMATLENSVVKQRNEEILQHLESRRQSTFATTMLSFTSPAGLSKDDIGRIDAALTKQYGHVALVARNSTEYRVAVPGVIDIHQLVLPAELAGVQASIRVSK